mmetsp:Transcript_4960/g.8505  ORF Transcript_4960/g.8505 Transcript_4960/m.8505 type:complete len:206 (+) Transcript_4960:868-1485(+)
MSPDPARASHNRRTPSPLQPLPLPKPTCNTTPFPPHTHTIAPSAHEAIPVQHLQFLFLARGGDQPTMCYAPPCSSSHTNAQDVPSSGGCESGCCGSCSLYRLVVLAYQRTFPYVHLERLYIYPPTQPQLSMLTCSYLPFLSFLCLSFLVMRQRAWAPAPLVLTPVHTHSETSSRPMYTSCACQPSGPPVTRLYGRCRQPRAAHST